MTIKYAIFSLVLCLGISPQGQADDAVSISVKEEGFTGTFYSGDGTTDRVGVMVLGGSEGGTPKRDAKRFADAGYPALAVGYFKTEGTPSNLDQIPLEYFEKPLTWFGARFEMANRRIVVVGGSKGGELALLIASRHREIAGVIAIAPSHVVFQGMPEEFWPPRSNWTMGGKDVPFVPYDISAGIDLQNLRPMYEQSFAHKDLVENARIPIEKINGPILILSGELDSMWPSSTMGNKIVATLKSKNFPHSFHHESYADAGHTLNEYFMIGGTKEGNKIARVDSWKRQVIFLKNLQERANKDDSPESTSRNP